MRLFDPAAHNAAENREIHAATEILYTAVDFTAAALFVIGSVMFFSEAWQNAGTWLFLVGSVCFALKPTIRLARELHYWRRGKLDRLAERADD
ncbi:YrhK family protein [Rhodovulum sp. DZ06]|uniref:YrhK family protein n=1 Tax=Rhodovulum sp. DZ06 TaxID=3425126 RepID=UPI003D355B3C